MLRQGPEVLAAWRFRYRTHIVSIKDRIGLGYWNRNQHELLMVGARGSVPAPAVGNAAALLSDRGATAPQNCDLDRRAELMLRPRRLRRAAAESPPRSEPALTERPLQGFFEGRLGSFEALRSVPNGEVKMSKAIRRTTVTAFALLAVVSSVEAAMRTTGMSGDGRSGEGLDNDGVPMCNAGLFGADRAFFVKSYGDGFLVHIFKDGWQIPFDQSVDVRRSPNWLTS
jgi:hypothetical protein